LHCRFVHRHARKVLKTYSESSFPDGSNDSYPELRNHNLKKRRQNDSRGAFRRQKPAETDQINFFTVNDDCSPKDWPRDLKLVSLEPTGNEDSEYFNGQMYSN
jgi:hypothetical protein